MDDGQPLVLGDGFTTPTDIDHRPWLWVAIILSLIYSFLCLGARILAKWGLFWYDDAILAAAYAFAVAHWGIIFSAAANGMGVLGSALPAQALDKAAHLYFVGRIPVFIALALSKLSVLVFTRRIFTGNFYGERIMFAVAYALVAVYGVLAVVLSSAGCRPGESLVAQPNAVCDNNARRWIVIIIFEVITEVQLMAIPIYFVSKNEMRMSKKLIVVFVYIFRVFVAAFAIGTVVEYSLAIRSGETSIALVPVAILQETLLCLSLLTASIPCLKPFVWAFMSRNLGQMYGTPDPSQAQNSYAMNSRRQNSFARWAGISSADHTTSNISHTRSGNHGTTANNGNGNATSGGSSALRASTLKLRPERSEYNVNVRATSSHEQIIQPPGHPSHQVQHGRRSSESGGAGAGGSNASDNGHGASDPSRMVIMRDINFEIARE